MPSEPWEEIAARLEAAKEPDREMDCELAVAVHGGEIVWKTANYTMEAYPARRHPNKNYVGGFCNGHVPAYTASVDATLALIAEKLPGLAVMLAHNWEHLRDEGRPDLPPFVAEISVVHSYGGDIREDYGGRAATPALALCAAFARAMTRQARAEEG